MRWTLTSPDGIGDFLLRLPWLAAAERAGWQLQLVARPPTLEAARLVGLECEPVEIRTSPYSKDARMQRAPYAREFAAIRHFDPGLVFFGPSQPTFFEDLAAVDLSDMPLGGFCLEDGFWPGESIRAPAEIAEAYAVRVCISASLSEPERNAAAARQLLGGTPVLEAFQFRAQRKAALAANSPVAKSPYLVVCAATRLGDYFTGLGNDRWSEELRSLEVAGAPPFVFAGSQTEAASHEHIRRRLHTPTAHTDLTGQMPTLEALVALLAGSAGYVGKDSGMMHLAGTLGLPVVAVFGGGHWGRFLPTRGPAVAVSADVPCRGCDWRCPFPEPYCATRVEVGCIERSWKHVQSLAADDIVVLSQAPGPDVLAAIGEAGGVAHARQVHAHRRESLAKQRRRALRSFTERLMERIARWHD